MKKRIRFLCMAALLCSGFLLLNGCGKEAQTEKPEKIRLEFYNRKREVYSVLDQAIKLFNESQDRIEVFQNTNTYVDTALRISTVEGDFPDIVLLGGLQSVETSEYVMGGYLRELDELPSSSRIKEEYKEHLLYNGHLYQMPLAMSFEGIYINRTLFEEEGLEIPETYEELCQVSEEIMKRGKVPFLFPDRDYWTIHQNWEAIEGAYRGNFQNLWTEVARGDKTFMEDEICRNALNKLIHIHQYTTEEYSNLGYDEAMDRFAKGEAFMFMQGSWAYRNIIKRNPQIQVEMIPFPVDKEAEQKVTLWVDSSVAISKNCKYPEEAEEFIEFLMRPEILQIYLDDESSFSCIEGPADRAEYAPRVNELIQSGHAEMDASWLPVQTSTIRDQDIADLMPYAEEEEIDAYLEKYTKSLRKHKDLFLGAKEKRCHSEEK